MKPDSAILERWHLPWWLLCLGLAAPFGLALLRLPAPAPAAPSLPPALENVRVEPVEARFWRVLQPVSGGDPAHGQAAPARFRLAGTFLSYSFTGEVARVSERYAILDALETKRQVLAHVGDLVDGWRVVEIEEDRARLEQNGRFVELTRTLTPLGEAPATVVTDEDPEKTGVPFWDQPALETSRFGKRIADNRWVLKREKVMEYYQELLADPERMVSLYKSFYPDRQNGEVAGFRLKFEGEQDFFKAVGIREADVVRSVNSMQMTSQRRAEFFIGEFARNNIEALVFDIERDGKEEQLIYLIR